MDPRYSTDIQALMTREAACHRYRKILAVVASAQHRHGVFDNDQVPHAIWHGVTSTVLWCWADYEKQLKHETAAFVKAVRHTMHPKDTRPYVYLGMTSSDLIDTAAAMHWNEVWRDHLLPATEELMAILISWSQEPGQRMGRTHGRIAEPVDIGAPYARAARDLLDVQMELNSRHYIPAKLSGPVGQYNRALTPAIAQDCSHALGVQMDENASQIVDRHFYRRVAADLVEIVSICEQLATLHRLAAISGVDTFAEAFDDGVQMGSSVMAFKRNPVRSERICGLARVVRGNYSALLETWSTGWWERDLSNSSVERTSWSDLIQLTHFIVKETAGVVFEGHWRSDVPSDYQSPVDELVQRHLAGEDPEEVFRDIQARACADLTSAAETDES